MTRNWIATTAAILFLPFALTGTSAAASIAPSAKLGCAIELSGEITAGDAARLAEIADRAGLTGVIESGEPKNSADKALCLDSPGGSYQEGQKMARFVHKHGIATRVLADAECLASCAFVFMGGRYLGGEFDGPRRILTVGGKLAFQAPTLTTPPQASFSGVDLGIVATRSMQVVAELMAFASYTPIFDHRPMYAMSLLQEILSTGPDEVRLVDTVEDVGRWNIELSGHRERAILSEEQLVQACNNFQAWSLDRPSQPVTDVDWQLPLPRSTASMWGEEIELALVDTGGMEISNCQVEISAKPVDWFAICSRDDFSGVRFGDCNDSVAIWQPWYLALPPATPLTDLR